MLEVLQSVPIQWCTCLNPPVTLKHKSYKNETRNRKKLVIKPQLCFFQVKLISVRVAHPDALNIDVLTGSCQFRVNYHRPVGPSPLGQREVLDEARVWFCPHTRQNVGD